MKSRIIVLLAVVSLAVSMDANGQKFLKKVGSALDKATEKIDQAASAILGDSGSQEVQQSQAVAAAEVQPAQNVAAAPSNLPLVAHSLRGNVKEIKETNVSGGKTNVSTFRFNENRQLTEMTVVSFHGNVTISRSYEYNPDGSIASTAFSKKTVDPSVYGAGNELHEVSVFEIPYYDRDLSLSSYNNGDTETTYYTYNPNGTVSSEKCTHTNGVQERFYDSNGNLLRTVERSGDNNYEYLYDGRGNLISQKMNGEDIPRYDYDDDYGDWDEGDSDPVIKKDAKGRIISEESDLMRVKYTYNQNDYISAINQSDRWWGDASTIYSGYEYDSHGNWISRTMKKTGDYYGKDGLTVKTTRTISYY